ncbi:MAG TPA: glycosyltransferase family 4 protein [Candidatus Paceibacterota bacterium]|nr:glycosyltransferase family 4 protein [Candidatus Paceibacterota bacterium]
MTRGMSLSKWGSIGMLAREIKPYQKLAEYFNKIYIFTYGDNKDKTYSDLFPLNVEIVTKPKFMPVLMYSFLLPFIHSKKLKNTHIIKTNQMDGSWSAVISKKLFNLKLVVRCGYEWLDTIEKLKKSFFKKTTACYAEKFAYNNADRIILTGEESKNFVTGRFSIDSNKIKIIPNYINIDLFKPLNIPKEQNRIIFIGRLEKEKNLINLFYGVKGLDVKLVVVGDGSLRAQLEDIANKEGINVIFKGNIPQSSIPEELNKSEIFILPSLYEGNPKVLLEAMSSGLACIGTDVQGINSIIKDGEDGVISQTDPISIKNAIIKLINDKELRDKIGINARKRIEQNNSFDIFIEKELSIYQSLINL